MPTMRTPKKPCTSEKVMHKKVTPADLLNFVTAMAADDSEFAEVLPLATKLHAKWVELEAAKNNNLANIARLKQLASCDRVKYNGVLREFEEEKESLSKRTREIRLSTLCLRIRIAQVQTFPSPNPGESLEFLSESSIKEDDVERIALAMAFRSDTESDTDMEEKIKAIKEMDQADLIPGSSVSDVAVLGDSAEKHNAIATEDNLSDDMCVSTDGEIADECGSDIAGGECGSDIAGGDHSALLDSIEEQRASGETVGGVLKAARGLLDSDAGSDAREDAMWTGDMGCEAEEWL